MKLMLIKLISHDTESDGLLGAEEMHRDKDELYKAFVPF
jgi:hypothetical protein